MPCSHPAPRCPRSAARCLQASHLLLLTAQPHSLPPHLCSSLTAGPLPHLLTGDARPRPCFICPHSFTPQPVTSLTEILSCRSPPFRGVGPAVNSASVPLAAPGIQWASAEEMRVRCPAGSVGHPQARKVILLTVSPDYVSCDLSGEVSKRNLCKLAGAASQGLPGRRTGSVCSLLASQTGSVCAPGYTWGARWLLRAPQVSARFLGCLGKPCKLA